VITLAPRTGALADKFGARWLTGGGMTLLAVMLFYYTQLGAHESWFGILPGLILGGVGMACTMTPTTAAAMSAVAVDKAGVGSAVLNSARQVGGSLGIAVMGAIVASTAASSAKHGDAPQIAYLGGFHDALRVGALLCVTGAVLAVLAVRKIEHPREAAHEFAQMADAA
jgi:MFS family permease